MLFSSFCILVHSNSNAAPLVMLVGNKCDLQHIRQVSREEGQSFANKEDLLFMEASALDTTNVANAFQTVIREVYKNVSRNVLTTNGTNMSSSSLRPIGSAKVVTFQQDCEDANEMKSHPKSKCCSA